MFNVYLFNKQNEKPKNQNKMENLIENEKNTLIMLITKELKSIEDYAVKSIMNNNPLFNSENSLKHAATLRDILNKLN